MAVLEILQEHDPLLRMKSDPIHEESFDDHLRDFASDMNDTLQSRRALGLSAVQVGVPVRLILVRMSDEGVIMAMANPVLVRTLRHESVEEEGCLSIGQGSRRRRVSRPRKCEVEWSDLEGNRKRADFSGLTARIILHELDHLDGILMTDKPEARG